MKTNNGKRKIIKDREFPSSEQINKYQDFDALQGNYTAVQKLLLKKGIIWTGAVVAVGTIATVVYLNVGKGPEKKVSAVVKEVPAKKEVCVTPPIPGQEMPYSVYRISAKNGGILKYPNGSSINIPANAFKHRGGEQVSDSIDIKYREFHTPLDIFLSGIPMEYDSAGIVRTLESAGMIDIRAFDDGQELLLNEETPINVQMMSASNDTKYNLYELDTVNNNWIYKGKDKVEIPQSGKPLMPKSTVKVADMNEETGITPQLADPEKFSFTIKYDKNEFPELAAYENVKFEVIGHNFKPQYYKINWKKIGLENSQTKGNYILKLTKADTTIAVEARPVFDKANYEAAMKKFDAAIKTTSESARLKEQQEQKALLQVNKELAVYNPKKIVQAALNIVGVSARFTRDFQVRSMGYHNIDFPSPPVLAYAYKIMSNSKQTMNKQTQNKTYSDIYLVEKGKNTVFRFKNGEPVRCNPNAKNLMWTVNSDNKIAFFRIDDYKKLVNGGQNNIDPVVSPNQEEAFNEIRKFSL